MSKRQIPCVQSYRRQFGRGFTLIELLVVVAIIGLLVSILLPALGKAKDQAKVAKTRATMKAIGDSLEMFKGDVEEECKGLNYPPSNVSDDPTAQGADEDGQMFGAQWLVRYLMGKRLDGYVPKRSIPKSWDSWDSEAGWEQKGWYNKPGDTEWPTDAGGTDPLPHVGPYMNAVVMPPRDLVGSPVNDQTGNGAKWVDWVFVDAFKLPICYYAANSKYGARPNATIATWAGNSDPNTYPNCPGIYEFGDNWIFTGMCSDTTCTHPAWDFGGGGAHIAFGPDAWKTNATQLHDEIGQHTTSWPYYIMDKQAWETSYGAGGNNGVNAVARPMRSDSFILWSPGKDGIFGTADDIHN